MNLGKVSMTASGSYDSTKSYERLTCVYYGGVSWISRKDVPVGVAPGTDSSFWQKVSERGERGATGATGAQGPQGNSAFDGNGVEIVNNLTKGGESAVLSAEQGKILDTKLATLSENGGVIIYEPSIENGAYITQHGNIATSESSCVSDFVKVSQLESVIIRDSWTDNNRSIAGYDKYKRLVLTWDDYTNGEELLIPENVEYLRITGRLGIAPIVVVRDRDELLNLKSNVGTIETEVKDIASIVGTPILSTIIGFRYSISAGAWISGRSILFDIQGKSEVYAIASQATYYAFLNSYDFNNHAGEFNEQTPKPLLLDKKGIYVPIPSDARYLWIQIDEGLPVPELLRIDNIDCVFDGSPCPVGNLPAKIEENAKKIEQLNEATPKFLDFSDVIVCSHRGNSAISCPENSLHSITNAAFQQMKIVECDVQFTSDGVPVVLHDGTLNRTMNTINDEELSEDVRVSDITWDELSKGYIYKTSVEKYKTRICTFWEWMDRVKQLKLIPFLHWMDASLIGRVQQYVGDNFIYMGTLLKCKEVRKLAPNCFIMYQHASQQTSTGELTDIDAVITDMHAIGGLCGYSSMEYATFTDEFVDKLRKNGYYWQFSTDVPSYSTECIRRGVDFLLINNWCNNHLTYKPLFKVADDLSNIIYTSLENGCPVLEQDASIPLSLAIKGNNVRLHIVCKGQVKVIVDGKVSQFGNDEYFAAYECGVNTISSEIGVTIYARSRVVIEELYIEES